jgi:hypothetical protein
MVIKMPEEIAYGDPCECIRAAKESMRQVKELLSRPSADSADRCSTLLREVEVQLGCAAAVLNVNGAKPDVNVKAELVDLQDQVAVLARFFGEADKLLCGWLRAVQTRRGGYTHRGHAAPLTLVNKLAVEG